jgi:hypothetical protein
MYPEEDDDRFERCVSMALVPIGAVFALLWILVFYCVIVRVSHLNWPNPLDWLPPDWARFLPRWLR